MNSFLEKIRFKLQLDTLKWLGAKYIEGHLVIPVAFKPNQIILDLGGNKGDFSTAISALGGNVYYVEPNPSLYENYKPTGNIIKINKAVSNFNGTSTFILSENDEASSFNKDIMGIWGVKETLEVQTCDLKTLLQEQGIQQVDLLKMDVEGSELDIIASLSDEELLKVPQLTVEFHEFLDEKLLNPTIETIRRLKARILGFGLFKSKILRCSFHSPPKNC